jgi:ABC-type nitrate/sulfonate/bicarbonate transport system substrate-binding protein
MVLASLMLAAAPARSQQLIDSTTSIPVFGLGFMVEMYAQDTQLYQKYGINMKMMQLNGLATINAVIAGSVDFGEPSGGSVTRAAARGQPLLGIVMFTDRIPTEVVLRKDVADSLHFDPKASLAQRAALLKGRIIAVDAVNSVIDAYVGLLAKNAGFTHDDIHVAPMEPPSMIAALKAKQIDGFAMAVPWTTMAVVDGSAVMLASGPNGDSLGLAPFAGTLVVAQPATCEKKPQLCQAVGQTFKEAVANLHAHPDEAEAILAKRFPNTDPKVFHAAFQTELEMTPNPPIPTEKAVENADNYNVAAGLMKPEEKLSDYNKLFTDKYVK